jgi:hypothetical protein
MKEQLPAGLKKWQVAKRAKMIGEVERGVDLVSDLVSDLALGFRLFELVDHLPQVDGADPSPSRIQWMPMATLKWALPVLVPPTKTTFVQTAIGLHEAPPKHCVLALSSLTVDDGNVEALQILLLGKLGDFQPVPDAAHVPVSFLCPE